MDYEEDAGFLSFLALAGDHGPLDELLNELLEESTYCEDAVGPQPLSRAVSSPRSTASESSDHGQSQRKRAKRASSQRPKQEIKRLRDAVRELQDTLQLLQKRQRGLVPIRERGASPIVEHAITAACPVPMWQSAATRQYRYLRESLSENRQLKEQLRTQLALTKTLVKMIQRNRTPICDRVLHWPLQMDLARLFFLRQHHEATATAMLADAAQILCDEMAYGHEFRSFLLRDEKDRILRVVPPGATLGTSFAMHHVPVPFPTLSAAIWEFKSLGSPKSNVLEIKHKEVREDYLFLAFTVTFQVENGIARFEGVGVRQCHRGNDYVMVTTSASLRALDSTLPPMGCVGFDSKRWVVVRATPSSPRDTCDVILKAVTLKPHYLPVAEPSTVEDFDGLNSYVRASHRHAHDDLQRFLDNLLMGANRIC